MQIIISHNSKEPIYEQIVNQIKRNILAGTLAPGFALPSMRKMAKDLDVSVITTKRAFEELEKLNMIYSIVGKGSFVVEQSVEMMNERKKKMIEEQLTQAIVNSKDLGISLEDVQELVALLYEEEV